MNSRLSSVLRRPSLAVIVGVLALVVGSTAVLAATQAPPRGDPMRATEQAQIVRVRTTAIARLPADRRGPLVGTATAEAIKRQRDDDYYIQIFATAAAVKTARANSTTPWPAPPTHVMATVPPPKTGLLQVAPNNCTLPGAMALLKNAWQDYVGGQLYRVCAGGDPRRPNMGLVVVQKGLPNDRDFTSEVYYPPSVTGGLTIVAVSPTFQVTLKAENGAVLVFDLLTRTFISGPGVTGAGTPAPAAPGAPTPNASPQLVVTLPARTPPPSRKP